jgi:GTP-binding protein YchF
MKLNIGIVGLPNVGKSTLFNALTKSESAQAANFPFCTIDPNVGIVDVPDQRLKKLTEIVVPEKVMPSSVEFVDIAGLVAGASEGEGLGNKFLSHIRDCAAICHVVRAFESSDIHHVSGSVDASRDLDVIMTELILADLQSVQGQLMRVKKKAKAGDKESKILQDVLQRVEEVLNDGKLAQTLELTDEEKFVVKSTHLLTLKPYIIVANVDENSFGSFDSEAFRSTLGPLAEGISVVPICAQIESELFDLSDEDAHAFLEELGADKSGLESLIKEAFRTLGLQSYFTAGVTEVRAWTINIGDTAPQAAGAIHTDFEKGFIKADVIAYQDFIGSNGEAGAKEAGKMRMEGKEYIVQDGDVMHFKFNV